MVHKSDLKEEIERLREELYQMTDRQESSVELLMISQRLDELILKWMETQNELIVDEKPISYNT